MKTSFALAATLFLVTIASPTLAQDEAKSNRFTLELRTKLGVARRIRVHITRTGDGLLDALGAYWGRGVPDYNWEHFPDARLAIQTGDDTFALVPWTSIKEITEKNKKQVVTLKDSTSYEGVIKTIAFVEDDKDQNLPYSGRKKYNLSTVTSLAVVQIPPRGKSRYRTKKPRSNKRWTLSSVAHEPRTRVKSVRFVFQYYTSAGYILGGTDTVSVTSAFILNVGGDKIPANADDFELLKFDSRDPKKSVLSVRARNADIVTGHLELVAKDSRGEHPANKWALALDMENGCTLVVRNPSLTLEQTRE